MKYKDDYIKDCVKLASDNKLLKVDNEALRNALNRATESNKAHKEKMFIFGVTSFCIGACVAFGMCLCIFYFIMR